MLGAHGQRPLLQVRVPDRRVPTERPSGSAPPVGRSGAKVPQAEGWEGVQEVGLPALPDQDAGGRPREPQGVDVGVLNAAALFPVIVVGLGVVVIARIALTELCVVVEFSQISFTSFSIDGTLHLADSFAHSDYPGPLDVLATLCYGCWPCDPFLPCTPGMWD